MKKQWSDIKVSFGDSGRIPYDLLLLTSSNKEDREQAYWDLMNLAVLQSNLFEAAYYIIDPLVEHLEYSPVDSFYAFDLLYEIFNGYADPQDLITLENGEKVQLTIACRQKISENIERLEQVSTGSEKELKAKNELLNCIKNPGELFPSKESILEVLKKLGIPPSAAGM